VGDEGPYAFVGERRPEAGDSNDVAEGGGTTSVMMFMDGILLLSSSPDMVAVEKKREIEMNRVYI